MLIHKLLLFIPLTLCGLDRAPWFCNLWEFTFTPIYTYSRYPSVQNGSVSHPSPSNDHLLSFDIGVSPASHWQFDTEVEFADTPQQSMGLRSGALQVRYLWLDDIVGDVVSLTTGGVMRGVSGHSIRDVSCPYQAYFNFELNASLGREWDRGSDWYLRTFGGGSIGVANQGYPWMSGFAVLEGQMQHAHRLGIILEGALGLGHRKKVNIDHFHGYAFIQHRNIDLGVKYTYALEIWGHLSFAYTRRLYARSFPEKVDFFTVSYFLPFSLF